MAEIEKKPLKITETILRDAHQSLIATRMTTEQMLPIVDKMDKVGYHAVECWGGATFDASLRFLKEDPWERLRKLRDGFKNTKLQMLFRGQNILGYNHYADDVVEYFVQKSIANGIDIIRIFDCLNDIRNLETAVNAANKENGHAQVALCYTLGDAYTLDYWKDMAKKIEDMGAKSLCIKDMAGLLVPAKATELVQALKESCDIPIDLHTHYTSGVASMTYMKAVEAGCDIIDTAMSPFSMGTSQPATLQFLNTIESSTGVWIKSITFSDPVAVYTFGQKASSNPSNTSGSAYQTNNVGYKETINVSYEGTYAEWKNLIGFINNYEKKNTIEALTTTYNEATDVVTGTMTLALYSITGNGREFSEPKFDLKTGTDNIFAKPAE